MSRGQFIKLERGERRLTAEYISQIARAFGVTAAEVISSPMIPVVGRIGAGGEIETEWENLTEPLFEVEMPFPLSDDAIGFEISGESMMPVYQSGDVIVVSRSGEPIERLIDQEAAVRVPGVGRFFKRIVPTPAPGLYDLESYNAKTMRGVQIEWASGLIARVPATRWRRINGAPPKPVRKRAKKG